MGNLNILNLGVMNKLAVSNALIQVAFSSDKIQCMMKCILWGCRRDGKGLLMKDSRVAK